MKIVWDESKNEENRRKHGLSFEEAQEIFAPGSDYLVIFDETHSELEDRFLAIGPILRGVVLVVWTEPDEDTLRIISARQATRHERTLYLSYKERTS